MSIEKLCEDNNIIWYKIQVYRDDPKLLKLNLFI